jgi:putative sigma-54 modulation protein
MRLSTLLTAATITTVSAFAPFAHRPLSSISKMASPPLQMSTESVSYVITGNNIDVTPALHDYVDTKLDKIVGKISSNAISECDVHLSVNKNPKVKLNHKAEVVAFVKGTVIRCAEETEDMYASIDAVTDRLAQKLRKYKERRLEGYHGGPNMGENLAQVLESLDQGQDSDEESPSVGDIDVDPEAPVINKIKSYDLSTPMSVQEAIFSLDYVDHDFFVFRDQETNEISVVYKRNAGGYGLISPDPQ